MTALITLLLVVNGSAPSVGLVETSRVGVSDAEVRVLLEHLAKRFTAAGFKVQTLPRQCEGDRDCLAKAGREHGIDAMVGVSFASALRATVVDLEVTVSLSGEALGQALVDVNRGAEDTSLGQSLRVFLSDLKARLPTEPAVEPVARADTPVKVSIVPADREAAPVVASSSKAPAVVATVATGGALIATVVMAAISLSDQSTARSGVYLSAYSQLESRGNATATGAVVAGAVAGSLTITSIILWVTR